MLVTTFSLFSALPACGKTDSNKKTASAHHILLHLLMPIVN
jgi:hypothetical protein